MGKILRVILVGLLVLVLVTAALAYYLNDRLQSDPMTLSAANDGLAFISDRDGSWDIFFLSPDGTLTNLTNGEPGQHDYFASWSMDGTAINFLSTRSGEIGPAQVKPGTDTGVRLLNPLQALSEMLANDLFDWDPAWSADGAMGYASVANGLAVNLDLYLRTTPDSEPIRLTNDGPGGPSDWFMAWSPDGTRFAYNSNREGGTEHIYLYEIETNTITPLTEQFRQSIHAAWSLDGQRILFVGQQENSLLNGELSLYTMNPDGSDVEPFDMDTVFQGDPVYAANGTQVAYMSNEDGNWNIYVMDADGDNVQRLTDNDANYLFPAWRPIPQTETTVSETAED